MEIRSVDGTGLCCTTHGLLYSRHRRWDETVVLKLVRRHMKQYHPRQWLRQKDDLTRGIFILA